MNKTENIISGRTFGTAHIEFGEDERGYLIAHATGSAGTIFVASRSWDVLTAASMLAAYGEIVDVPRIGTGQTQEAAVAEFAAIEAEDALSRASADYKMDESTYAELAERIDRAIDAPLDQRVAEYRAIAHEAFDLTRR